MTVRRPLVLSSGRVAELPATDMLPVSASGFRNRIVGGDFYTNPWQRGTSFTALANGAHCADRWLLSSATEAVVNVLKTTDGPTVAQAGIYSPACIHFDVTTADTSIGATQYYMIQHRFEGWSIVDLGFGQSGTRYVTLSFWHKHTKTGTYCVALTDASVARSYIAEYTQSVTDTWEFSSITIPVDTAAWGMGLTSGSMRVFFTFACGSTYHTSAGAWTTGTYFSSANQVNAMDSTSNNCKLALIQLEPGEVATPFEVLPYPVVLQLARRCYREMAVRVQESSSHTQLALEMRATPTVTGGGTGFSYATDTTAYVLDCYQETAAIQTLKLAADV